MKINSLVAFVVAGGAPLVAAHATVWNILVNGVNQGVGNQNNYQGVSYTPYIDSPPNNSPVYLNQGATMICNVPGVQAQRSITVGGSDTITFEWHHNDNSAGDDIIADSHHGPILVYISKAGMPGSWTKLWHDGYDGTSWAVDKLIAGSYTGVKGQHKVTLPNLAPGDYYLRPEIIALHEANNMGGAQFYMECVHIHVTGSGTVTLPSGVTWPGAYNANDPGIYVNIYYNMPMPYVIPGPAVFVAGASNPSPTSSTGSTPTTLSTAVASNPASPASSTPAAPPASPSPTPSALSTGGTSCTNTGGSVPQYSQCGGRNYNGATKCVWPYSCQYVNDYYSQCLTDPNFNSAACGGGSVPRYGQCGGQNYKGDTKCQFPYNCQYSNPYYSQCL